MKRTLTIRRTASAVTAGVLALVGLTFGTASPAAAAPVAIDLYAVAGTTTLPGGQSVPVWGYAETSGATLTAPGGPVLEVDEGDLVTLTLHNELAEDTGLLFQGQALAPDFTGAPAGGTAEYTFTAGQAGTYLYEAGLLPGTQYQTAMGLHGALIVHPTAGPTQAYLDAGTAYDTDAALVLSELDPALNNSADPAGFDMRTFNPRYSLINGQAHPDVTPIAADAGNTVLLRYVNAGVLYHSMGVLGAGQTVIALDGSLLDFARHYTAETIGPGQTADSLVLAPDVAASHSLSVYDASLLLHNSNTGGAGGMYTSIAVTGTPANGDVVGPVSSGAAVTGSLLQASVSDADRGNANVTAAEYFIDTVGAEGSGTAMSGSFGSPTVTANALVPDLGTQQQHVLYVRGYDGANWGPVTSVLVTASDQGGPATQSLSLTPSVTNHDASKPGVAISATADDSGSGNSTIHAAEYRIDGGLAVSMTVTPADAATVASVDATIARAAVDVLTEGTHSISVRSQDSDGNWGAETSAPLQIDTTGPSTSGTQVSPSPNNGSLPLSSSIQAVRVSVPTMVDLGSNVVRAEMFIDAVGASGSGIVLISSDGGFNSTEEGGYADIPLSTVKQLSEGDHTISVHAKDAAGNWGAFETATLTVDRTAPAAASGASVAPNPTQGARLVTLTATVSDNAVNAAEWFIGADPGAGKATPLTSVSAAAGTMTGTLDVGSFAEGSYTVQVRVRDSAGNWSAGVTPASFTVTAPLYFSTVGNGRPDGVTGPVDDSDVYSWSGSAFSRIWDGSNHGVPAPADVDGFDRISDTHFYVSFAPDNTVIAGFGTVQDEDVLEYDNGTWSMFFNGTSHGLTAASQDIDAINVVDGTLYFSTRGNGRPTGVTGPVDNADIYSWDGASFARVFDASANGLPGAANVDGVVWLDASHFYLSFVAANTAITGFATVQDEDVVFRNGNVWSVYFNGTAHGLTANSQDVDAFDLP